MTQTDRQHCNALGIKMWHVLSGISWFSFSRFLDSISPITVKRTHQTFHACHMKSRCQITRTNWLYNHMYTYIAIKVELFDSHLIIIMLTNCQYNYTNIDKNTFWVVFFEQNKFWGPFENKTKEGCCSNGSRGHYYIIWKKLYAYMITFTFTKKIQFEKFSRTSIFFLAKFVHRHIQKRPVYQGGRGGKFILLTSKWTFKRSFNESIMNLFWN